MPGRRVPSARHPQPSKDEGDLDFSLSPDHGNETLAAVAAEFKATWEKKMRGRDDKFIHAAKQELDGALQSSEIEITQVVHDIETVHQDFLEKYAILEDRKRKIMVAIAEKQEELIPLAVKRHQAAINLGYEVENGQLEGMASIKAACQRLHDVSQDVSTLAAP